MIALAMSRDDSPEVGTRSGIAGMASRRVGSTCRDSKGQARSVSEIMLVVRA